VAEDEAEPVGTSQTGPSDFEQATVVEPFTQNRKYVLRVNNFAATPGKGDYEGTVTFTEPPEFVAAQIESWTLTCETAAGAVRDTRQVIIDRNERQTLDLSSACLTPGSSSAQSNSAGQGANSGTGTKVCASTSGGIRGKRVGRVPLARKRIFQRRLLRRVTRLRSSRGATDRYCQAGGGVLRIGYPAAKLLRSLSPERRLAVRRKAILALSTNRRFRLRGVGVGTSTRTLARRLRGERRFRVGPNVFYTASAGSSRLLFRTRAGKVRELGVANKRLTRTRRGTLRFLRALG